MLEKLLYFLSKIIFFTGSVLTGSSFKKPLSEEEEKELILKAKAGDKAAKEKLLEHNMRLVAHVVKKYKGAAETDDLLSVGSLGLAKAINTYSPDKNVRLATFAGRCIENEILMLIRSDKKHRGTISLDSEVGTDKDGNTLKIIDVLTEDEDSVFKNADNMMLRTSILKKMRKVLNKREFTVICLRYGLYNGRCFVQREVAKILKISRSYVSRIEKRALEKLKTVISPETFGTTI